MTKETALQIWPVFALIMVLCVWIVIMTLRQGRHGRRLSEMEAKQLMLDEQAREFRSAIDELKGLNEQLDRMEGKLGVLIDRG